MIIMEKFFKKNEAIEKLNLNNKFGKKQFFY